MDDLAEADIEIVNGELWKAKEILHKSVKNSGYDLKLYEKLGYVLLKMGDKLEAGKYLFLSGTSDPEYSDAIGLYLERYRDKRHNLFHPFPRAAKLPRVSDYPENVADKLRELGFADGLEEIHQIGRPRESGVTDRLAFAIFILVIVAVLILLGLGLVKLFEIIFK